MKSVTMGNSLRMLLTACAALFISVGCTTTSKMAKPLSDFSVATTDATTVTTFALSIVQAADQEEAIINASKLTELREEDVLPVFRPNDLLQRQLTLQALSTYAATLKSLSGVDRSADIQKSFDSLKTSMESTATSITKLSEASKAPIPSGVVSSLVALGSIPVVAYSVGEREKAIRTALQTNDNAIAGICRLLAAELEPRGMIYKQLQHAYRRQEEAAIDSFKAAAAPKANEGAPEKGKPTPPDQAPNGEAKDQNKPPAAPKPSELAPIAKTFIGVRNKKEYSLALLSSLASTYRKLAHAHTALKAQSETGAKSDIQLKALAVEIDNVKFFYSQIPK